jgi:hypothetical protein
MLRDSGTASPSTGWNLLALDDGDWLVPGDWDGADVRVQLVNNMTMAGDPWPVDIDWLRIKDPE